MQATKTTPTIENEADELEELRAHVRAFTARLREQTMHGTKTQRARLDAIYAVEQVLKMDDELSRRVRGYGLVGLARDVVHETSNYEGLSMIGAVYDLLSEIDGIIANDIDIENIGLALRAASLAQWGAFVDPFIGYATRVLDHESIVEVVETIDPSFVARMSERGPVSFASCA